MATPADVLRLQRTAGNRATRRLLPPPAAARPGAPVIRRKVGIEYETGIEARKSDGANRVPQDERMYDSGHGWKIDSDNSKLEFVTEPPVEANALGGVVDNMLDSIDQIAPTLRQAQADQDMSALFPQGARTENYKVQPFARTITGSPQGTIGIKFKNLFKVFELLKTKEFDSSRAVTDEHHKTLTNKWAAFKKNQAAAVPQALPYGQGELDSYNASVKKEKKAGFTGISPDSIKLFNKLKEFVEAIAQPLANQLQADELEKLKGMLHLVGQYAVQTTQTETTSYKKVALTLMTRSSFRSMYEALDATAQGKFKAAVTSLLAKLEIDPEAKAFKNQQTGFKVGDWLNSIETPGRVFLPTNQDGSEYDEVQSDMMTAPGIWKTQQGGSWTDKSMGGMGLDDGKVVVELRRLKHFAEVGTYTTSAMRKMAADLKSIIAVAEA